MLPADNGHPRLPYIDLLRVIAILYIVAIHHLDDYAGDIYYIRYNLITYIVLGLFMFISGYLLARNTPINGWYDVKAFLQRRFLRIYPLYVLALFLFMACSLISPRDVLLHIPLLNILLDNSVLTLWFVSVLCVFYLLYPLIAYRYNLTTTVIIGFWIWIIVILLHAKFGLFDERLARYLPLFLMGIVFAKHRLEETVHWSAIAGVAIMLVGATLAYIWIPVFNDICLILLMMAAIPLLLAIGKRLSVVVPKRLCLSVSYTSFCMYLLHRVVFDIAVRIYDPSNDILMVTYLTLTAVPVVYFISFCLQRGYDQAIRQAQHV